MDDEASRTAVHQISSLCSIHDNQFSNIDIANMSKKRKFLAESAENSGGFPSSSKRKCFEPILPAECDSLLAKVLLEEDRPCGHKCAGKAIVDSLSIDTEVGSVQDSNSFGGDSYSTCIKLDLDDIKNTGDEGSTAWSVLGRDEIGNVWRSSDSQMISNVALHKGVMWARGELCSSGKDDMFHDIEVTGKKNKLDYIPSEFGHEGNQLTDDELEDILYSNGFNPNVYMLSSERWNTDQEAQTGTRKPTIDQEFEQYFSMLMFTCLGWSEADKSREKEEMP
ncbi:hypothetical protein Dimus_007386 [Dionaea muscipula]